MNIARHDQGKRTVFVIVNDLGTVTHTMIEQNLGRAYIYKDLCVSEKAISLWLEYGMPINPSECIPYYKKEA